MKIRIPWCHWVHAAVDLLLRILYGFTWNAVRRTRSSWGLRQPWVAVRGAETLLHSFQLIREQILSYSPFFVLTGCSRTELGQSRQSRLHIQWLDLQFWKGLARSSSAATQVRRNTTDFMKKGLVSLVHLFCVLFLKRRSITEAKRVPEMSVRFICYNCANRDHSATSRTTRFENVAVVNLKLWKGRIISRTTNLLLL